MRQSVNDMIEKEREEQRKAQAQEWTSEYAEQGLVDAQGVNVKSISEETKKLDVD